MQINTITILVWLRLSRKSRNFLISESQSAIQHQSTSGGKQQRNLFLQLKNVNRLLLWEKVAWDKIIACDVHNASTGCTRSRFTSAKLIVTYNNQMLQGVPKRPISTHSPMSIPPWVELSHLLESKPWQDSMAITLAQCIQSFPNLEQAWVIRATENRPKENERSSEKHTSNSSKSRKLHRVTHSKQLRNWP